MDYAHRHTLYSESIVALIFCYLPSFISPPSIIQSLSLPRLSISISSDSPSSSMPWIMFHKKSWSSWSGSIGLLPSGRTGGLTFTFASATDSLVAKAVCSWTICTLSLESRYSFWVSFFIAGFTYTILVVCPGYSSSCVMLWSPFIVFLRNSRCFSNYWLAKSWSSSAEQDGGGLLCVLEEVGPITGDIVADSAVFSGVLL